MKFSANLGFLWADRSLPDAVRAAAAAGFDAVELHWPYGTPVPDLRAALEDTGLPVLGLNTRRGDVAAGENGLSALTGREAEARAAIDEALGYGSAIGAKSVHAMAGGATGRDARITYLSNLQYAATRAAELGMGILIEPLNRHDSPGYFLSNTDQARTIIEELDFPNLRLMFDCYHVARTEGDVTTRLAALKPILGHVQVASVPDRGPPDHGELHYPAVFGAIAAMGWAQPVGAEYKPGGDTDATLGWLGRARSN